MGDFMNNKGALISFDIALSLVILFIFVASATNIITYSKNNYMLNMESMQDVQDLMELLTTQEIIENQTTITYLSQNLNKNDLHSNTKAKSIIENFMETNAPDLNYQFREINILNKTIASKGEINDAKDINTAIRHCGNYTFQLSCWRI